MTDKPSLDGSDLYGLDGSDLSLSCSVHQMYPAVHLPVDLDDVAAPADDALDAQGHAAAAAVEDAALACRVDA